MHQFFFGVFFTAGSWEKDTENGVPGNCFAPSYFETAVCIMYDFACMYYSRSLFCKKQQKRFLRKNQKDNTSGKPSLENWNRIQGCFKKDTTKFYFSHWLCYQKANKFSKLLQLLHVFTFQNIKSHLDLFENLDE